jgi:endoplasmic reticulum-Golgi intermediate compartment protein 3
MTVHKKRVKTQQGEGCSVHGFLDVSKVAGNFHFAPGKGFYESKVDVPELSVLEGGFNVSKHANVYLIPYIRFFFS